MIQRLQTIWLLLAAAAAFSTLKFSFYSGNRMEGTTRIFEYFTAQSNLLLLILTAGVGLLAFISIFLFKNRKLQFRLTIIAIIVSLINLVLYFTGIRKFVPGESNYDLTAILAIIVPVLLFMAARGIRKDEKLVKSLDRLR
jgi:uncharacterized membrane protein YsdA (DUF1294 family)